jgi:hypothetical protein
MLNYLYALLESEARLAAATLGLDPGLGVLHVDASNRDSLALDILEPIRAQVDAYVIDWITRQPLRREWFLARAGWQLPTDGIILKATLPNRSDVGPRSRAGCGVGGTSLLEFRWKIGKKGTFSTDAPHTAAPKRRKGKRISGSDESGASP